MFLIKFVEGITSVFSLLLLKWMNDIHCLLFFRFLEAEIGDKTFNKHTNEITIQFQIYFQIQFWYRFSINESLTNKSSELRMENK